MKGLTLNHVIEAAKEDGDRVVADGKVIWGGLGNRAGLYGYADKLIDEKWSRSSKTFLKKLAKLQPGTRIEIRTYRGRNWVTTNVGTVDATYKTAI